MIKKTKFSIHKNFVGSIENANKWDVLHLVLACFREKCKGDPLLILMNPKAIVSKELLGLDGFPLTPDNPNEFQGIMCFYTNALTSDTLVMTRDPFYMEVSFSQTIKIIKTQ